MNVASAPDRDYAGLLKRHGLSAARPPLTREPEAFRRAIDLLWGGVGIGMSWIGFYEGRGEEMVLLCREPKPACSPIGLHGMCGRSWRERRPVIIADVATLGAEYIACDPADRSEVVVPVLNADGTCWGVLDADSYDLGSFGEHDAAGMAEVLVSLGLSAPAGGTALRL